MRRTSLILVVASVPLWAQTLTQGERDFAMSSLHASRKMLLDSLAGLSQAQSKFKPGPDRWSISEVVEHLVLGEDYLFRQAQEMLKSPAVAPGTGDRTQDAKWLSRMADRSQKAQAKLELQPTGQWTTLAALREQFRQRRDRTIEYIQATQDALRAHRNGSGEDAFDAYQLLLMIAGHTERHVAQINEVKADPSYPK